MDTLQIFHRAYLVEIANHRDGAARRHAAAVLRRGNDIGSAPSVSGNKAIRADCRHILIAAAPGNLLILRSRRLHLGYNQLEGISSV